MSANGSAYPQEASEITDKGKGKAVEQPTHEMMDEDESESEESGAEQQEDEEEEEDNLDTIDPSNITNSRTRGKQIDWIEAEQRAKEAGDNMDDDEDDDEDDDFEDPDQDHGDPMEE